MPFPSILFPTSFTTILFGDSSLFKERVRDKKILNGFYTGWEHLDDISTFYITAASINTPSILYLTLN